MPTLTDLASPAPADRERIDAFRSHHLGNERPVDVFLPPGYDSAAAPRCALLILNDGQEADALGLPAALARLHAERRIAPTVAVAVHATAERLAEYGTAGVPNAYGQGARAAAYDAFVCGELLPALAARYRLLEGPRHRALAGLSLGGLMAFDTAWSHADLFGAVGVFSGSFWWRTDNSSVRARVVSRVAHRKVRSEPSLPRLRVWLQAGTEDEESDRDGDGVIDAIQDTRELIQALAERGYRDVAYREVPGGRHEPATWARLLPDFLTWAFPNGERRT